MVFSEPAGSSARLTTFLSEVSDQTANVVQRKKSENYAQSHNPKSINTTLFMFMSTGLCVRVRARLGSSP